jgi:hypothetical protein
VHHPRRVSTSLEARLGNPIPTHFQVKQATRSECVSRAIFILPSVLWRNQQIIAHMVLRSKPRNHRSDFVGQITKPQLPVLRHKPKNPSEWFWGQTTRTVSTGFKAKSGETVGIGFEAKLRNTHSSSPYARCRPYKASPDLWIIRPPSTRPVLDHPQSSASSLVFLPRSTSLPAMPHQSPTHHETSKHISPHETDSRAGPPKFLGFKFKPWQVNYSS